MTKPFDHPVCDADRHVIEPIGLWRDFLPTSYRQRAPRYRFDGDDLAFQQRLREAGLAADGARFPPWIELDGQPLWRGLSDLARAELAVTAWGRREQMRQSQHPRGQLASMDAFGLDVAVLYPTDASFLVSREGMDPLFAEAIADAYNRWMHAFCLDNPARLRAVGLLSLHRPDTLVAQVSAILKRNVSTVVLRPNPVAGRNLSHPDYEDFWSCCAAQGVSVSIHEGTHAWLPTAGADRFDSRFAKHACSHPMEQMIALLSLIEGGVLERHPTLQIALLEAGCGWLPYWLWRLDELEYRNLAREVAPNVKRLPSEYFRRQCYIGVEPDEPLLADVIDAIGADRILFGTDFPHLDHDPDELGHGPVQLKQKLDGEVVRKLLWENPKRYYGLDDAAPSNQSLEPSEPISIVR